MTIRSLAMIFVLALIGCGSEPGTEPSPVAPGTPATTVSYLLPADIPDTVPVLQALKGTEGQEIALVGKLQAKQKGRAIFRLTDESVPDCTRSGDDACPTPWDYCCHIDEMKAGSILVELRGADGNPVKVADLGIRELDVVAVRGTLTKGEGDRLFLLAKDGWYRRARPKVPAKIKFP